MKTAHLLALVVALVVVIVSSFDAIARRAGPVRLCPPAARLPPGPVPFPLW